MGLGKFLQQQAQIHALGGQGVQPASGLCTRRHEAGKAFKPFNIAAGQKVRETIAQVPGVERAHAQHRQQHGRQQHKGLGVG